MSYDARGVKIHWDDLVVWFGKLGKERQSLHVGAARGAGIFSSKIKVELVRHGEDGEWVATGIYRSVRSDRTVVVDNIPESPYE
jgi:hypothetical protein